MGVRKPLLEKHLCICDSPVLEEFIRTLLKPGLTTIVHQDLRLVNNWHGSKRLGWVKYGVKEGCDHHEYESSNHVVILGHVVGLFSFVSAAAELG